MSDLLVQVTNNGQEICSIGYDGKVKLADGYSNDDAARLFWDAVGRNRPGAELDKLKTIIGALLAQMRREDCYMDSANVEMAEAAIR